MIQLRVLDVLAGVLWVLGVTLLAVGTGEDNWRTAVVSLPLFAGASTATALSWVARMIQPILTSCELASAVVRLNGHRSPERV